MGWRYRDTVLALCTLAFFATMVARLAISPVVPAVTDEFAVSNTVVGIALSGLWLFYFLTQFPSGILADRYGERPVILLAVGGTGIAALALALSPGFVVFVGSTFALGALAGLHYSVATTLLTRTYDDIGTAIGIHSSGGPAAGLIAPALAAWIGVRYGWRPAVLIGTVVAIPIFALFAWRIRPTEPRRPDQPMSERFELASALELLSRPRVAFPIALAIAAAFVWQGTASFLPTFLVEYRGHSTTLAGVVFSAYFVVQAITQVGVGAVSDRYGRDFATAGCMVLASAGFILLVAVPGPVAVATAVLLVGTGLGWGAALLPRFMDVLSDTERGAGFGLVRTVYGVVGSVGSVATGLFADLFGWAVSFSVLAALLALVFVALVVNAAFSLEY
ncbi:MFS transporter [Natrialbaceae archaeon AArc-T1-2]|uniref:MFS transporter n=1 Tax=Natrialbaceae archaeon AArc-T1-2 TaxID=3053904 RepID=UPI00255AB9D1|nr:MFS transporter [Natrialbaceae archaeon AArc-T1-2]WIV66687.1 MFS transporter [Natrialbaceae archaeon AArc-T1-2]